MTDLVLYLKRYRFSAEERIFFVKRLSFLVRAGIPLMDSLQIIQEHTRNSRTAACYGVVIDAIESGIPLAQSIERVPGLLDPFSQALIAAGEQSGTLERNLTYLAGELAKRDMLAKKLIGAIVYPACISIATLGIVIMLMVYIFPKILPIFASLHVQLPLSTRILIAVSSFLVHWGILTAVILFLAVTCFLYLRHQVPQLRFHTDAALLRLPLFGPLAAGYDLSNFCRTTSLMLMSGMPLVDALERTALSARNSAYHRGIARAVETVLMGQTLSQQLARDSRLFPTLATGLIAAGERSGTLAETLGYLAELYENDIDERTRRLSSSLEPLLMVTMGLVVGLVAVSIITPIYGITQHFSS